MIHSKKKDLVSETERPHKHALYGHVTTSDLRPRLSPSPELTIESVLGKERIIEIQLREDETI